MAHPKYTLDQNRYHLSEQEILHFLNSCKIPKSPKVECFFGPAIAHFNRNSQHDAIRVRPDILLYHLFVDRTGNPKVIQKTCGNRGCINPWHMSLPKQEPIVTLEASYPSKDATKTRPKRKRSKKAPRPIASTKAPNHERPIPEYYFTDEWASLRNGVIARDKGICQYCGEKGWQADHIVPRGKGGDDHPDNLACACPDCNKAAGGKQFATFESKKQYILKKRGLIVEKHPRPKLRGSTRARIKPIRSEPKMYTNGPS